MTATVTFDAEYVTALQTFGNVEDLLKDAVRSYTIERIGKQIGHLQHEIMFLQRAYGLPYEQFYIHVTTDEGFMNELRRSHPTWERDFQTWEYYLEELNEWLGRLERISNG